eukprot:TRINITY_DN2736_c0_g2_i1.p2 TRINITY_DN2736_c0_g2~~TRINITY_DN2736_c0_g2_i1.p2  ORF type:complete len:103 (+),score=8.01 TRINITY_DN2736_c0_g2_i1:390-698(+)
MEAVCMLYCSRVGRLEVTTGGWVGPPVIGNDHTLFGEGRDDVACSPSITTDCSGLWYEQEMRLFGNMVHDSDYVGITNDSGMYMLIQYFVAESTSCQLVTLW